MLDPVVKARGKNPERFPRNYRSLFPGCLSDLQKQEERGELLRPLLFVSLVACSVLLYFKVSLMDPGFVKAEEEEQVYLRTEQSGLAIKYIVFCFFFFPAMLDKNNVKWFLLHLA